MSGARPPAGPGPDLVDLAVAALAVAVAVAGVAWAGAWCAATLTGHPPPPLGFAGAWRLLAHPGDPAAAWGTPMPGPLLYWAITGVLAALVVALTVLGVRGWRALTSTQQADPRRLPGTATASQVTAAAGRRVVTRRAAHTRPSLANPSPSQVGYRLGTARGRAVWASVEDSMLLLGPPRSGKGLHLVIPADPGRPRGGGHHLHPPGHPGRHPRRPREGRPGARVRPATPRRRGPRRDGLVPDPRLPPPADRDDPRPRPGRRHRDDPHPGRRGLLGRPNRNRPTRAAARRRPGRAPTRGAVPVVAGPGRRHRRRQHPHPQAAAPGWDDALDAALHADPRTRDSIWLGVRQALGALADPRVLAAVTPTDEQAFDPAAFLAEHGTLFLLGTAAGAGAAASLVAALVEDIVETARHTAAAAPRARLDPPLLLALDEIGTLAPLPSLPALMSDGGGSGITTLAVLQSLSQARDKWGEQQAGTLWDAAIVKLILGGGSHARDLADLSALIGERDEPTHTIARDATGTRSSSTSTRRVPVLDPSRLRTLPFGTAVLLLRTAPPIVLDLHPWTTRPTRPN